jgi:prepilin-type N-terminal cleavage/methylation domain-containing protein
MLDMRGFTLIEILVSVSIFAVVMTMSLGALLAMSESNRRVETMKAVINTLNFSLDSMSRAIRTGYQYHCATETGGDCPAGASYLNFTSSDGALIEYRYNTDCDGDGNTATIYKCIERQSTPQSGSPSGWSSLTSKEVVIEALTFYVVGVEVGDNVQPKVTILLSGYVVTAGGGSSFSACGTTAQCSSFNLQTSVTQRIYDQ